MPFTAGQTLTAATLNAVPRLIARGRRTTSSSATTSATGIGVLRLDDIPITAGRAYWVVTSPLAVVSSTAGDIPRAKITFTTDGSTPTASSSTLPGGQTNGVIDSNNQSNNDVISTVYVPSGNETLSLLLCVLRASGSGSASIDANAPNVIDMYLFDMGEDPGDTGTDL